MVGRWEIAVAIGTEIAGIVEELGITQDAVSLPSKALSRFIL